MLVCIGLQPFNWEWRSPPTRDHAGLVTARGQADFGTPVVGVAKVRRSGRAWDCFARIENATDKRPTRKAWLTRGSSRSGKERRPTPDKSRVTMTEYGGREKHGSYVRADDESVKSA